MSPRVLEDTLLEHERMWNERPLLRELYAEWFNELAAQLSGVDGVNVEIGAGIGQLRSVIPNLVTTDVEQTQWADLVADAQDLPFADATIANLVLIDVFHHLVRPERFLDEAARVLASGGRIVMLEPYCSPLSTLAYRFGHPEPVDLAADPFSDAPQSGDDPYDANTAIPTIVFFRRERDVASRWPSLRIVLRRRLALLAYPLSGGLSGTRLLPAFALRVLARVERRLGFLAPLAAFRCLVVLEKR